MVESGESAEGEGKWWAKKHPPKKKKKEKEKERVLKSSLCWELELGGRAVVIFVDYTLLLLFCFWGHYTNTFWLGFF